MKSLLIASTIAALTLSGCVVISKKQTEKQAYSDLVDFKEPAYSTKVLTRGQLICESGKVCPELSVDWKQDLNQTHKLILDIYEPESYNIQQFTFVVDGETFTYNAAKNSTQRQLPNSNIINSSNYASVPTSLLNKMTTAQSILVTLKTNRGDLSNYMLESGKQSNAYKLFLRRINNN